METPATPPAELGATASATDLQRGILLHTLGLAAAGLALGLANRGFWRARWDACCSFAYAPATRASRIDPMIALRSN